MNIINNNNITYNAIDDLYNQVTGLPYSASAAAGNAGPGPEPVPTHNITFEYAKLCFAGNIPTGDKKAWEFQFNFTSTDELPEGWHGTIEANQNTYVSIQGEQPHATTTVFTFDTNTYYDSYYATNEFAWVIGNYPTSISVKIYDANDNLWAETTTALETSLDISITNITAVEQESHEYLFGFEVGPTGFDFNDLPSGWQGEAVYSDPETGDEYRMCIFNADNIASATSISKLTSFEHVPENGAEAGIYLLANDEELGSAWDTITITPYVSAKFTLNSVSIEGPVSGGPFSNVFDAIYDITFNTTPPTPDEYGGYNGTATITSVCVADETGIVKDTGNYAINGICASGTDGIYRSGDPTYPYLPSPGPATLTILDENNQVWATASTDNVNVVNSVSGLNINLNTVGFDNSPEMISSMGAYITIMLDDTGFANLTAGWNGIVTWNGGTAGFTSSNVQNNSGVLIEYPVGQSVDFPATGLPVSVDIYNGTSWTKHNDCVSDLMEYE